MLRNLMTWLAICSSVVAGTFASQLAAKYSDRQPEVVVHSLADPDQAGYLAVVALSGGAASVAQGVPE